MTGANKATKIRPQQSTKKFSCFNKFYTNIDSDSDSNTSCWWHDRSYYDYNTSEDMNGTNYNCSCHKERRCSRLTCCRYDTTDSTRSKSRDCEGWQLYALMVILWIVVPFVFADQVEAVPVDTSTSSNNAITTIPPPSTLDEVEFTTAITPHLPNTQTIIIESENIQSKEVTHSDTAIVNETEATLPNIASTQHFNSTISLGAPQDVNNEISQTVNEGAPTLVRETPEFINPKFEYTESLLTGNLEETIRNSVKNEIEFEHDIGSAVAEHLHQVTALEELQVQSEELSAEQSENQQGEAEHSDHAADVVTELTSSTAVTTESTSAAYSSAVETDLSIFFPAQVEERPTAEKNFEGIQRDPRNLNVNVNENSEILHENTVSENKITEEGEKQNIEEKESENQEGLRGEGKSSKPTSLDHSFEAEFKTHESNEILEPGSQSHAMFDDAQKDNDKAYHSNKSHESTDIKTEKIDNAKTNTDGLVGDESLHTTQEDHGTIVAEADEERHATELTPAEEDTPSLSIVLNENLTAIEPIEPIANSSLEELTDLEESQALLSEEPDTTVGPEAAKSVHIVIKKPGVDLQADAIESIPNGVQEETTIKVDLEQENADANRSFDEEEIVGTTLYPLVGGEGAERLQSLLTSEKETVHQLEPKTNEETLYEPTVNNEIRDVERNAELNSENYKSSDAEYKIDTNQNELSDSVQQKIDDNADAETDNELQEQFKEKTDDLNENKYFIKASNELDHHEPTSTTAQTHAIASARTVEPTAQEPVIIQVTENNNLDSQGYSTTAQLEQLHISLFSTTANPSAETHPTPTQSSTELQTITEDESNCTDDPDIVPILVGVSAAHGDVTASTKGSRSINKNHPMLLKTADAALAAVMFDSYPPQDAEQMFNDHSAAEGGGIIGKPQPARSVSKALPATLFSRSGLIIVVCSIFALIFVFASVVGFLISFQRQHGTLDIEMQEQRCGKDNFDEEDEEAGTSTRLLEIELPKSSIVTVACEELEECL